jgi:hypothetical protein
MLAQVLAAATRPEAAGDRKWTDSRCGEDQSLAVGPLLDMRSAVSILTIKPRFPEVRRLHHM